MEEEKLKKIVQLAKHGDGGEKESALRLVRKICAKNDLDFDEVMSEAPTVHEFSLTCRGKAEAIVLTQTIYKFAFRNFNEGSWWRRGNKTRLYFETTTEKYIDTMTAWDILRKQMRKESEKVALAMVYKHELFYQPRPDEMEEVAKALRNSKTSPEQYAKAMAAQRMAASLDDVEIQRRLKK